MNFGIDKEIEKNDFLLSILFEKENSLIHLINSNNILIEAYNKVYIFIFIIK